jgi:toxin secretion/phage lysis holin
MEKLYQTLAAIGAALITFAFGGWSGLLTVLLAFAITDYVTGVTAAAKKGELSSNVGLWGIAKKALIFLIVAMGHLIDIALGTASVVMDAIIYFYLSNEVLSIMENVGEIGVPLPPILEKAIAIFKEKGDVGLDGAEKGK